MDDPEIDPERHRHALNGLACLNRVSGSARLIYAALADLMPSASSPPLRILDVATGAGDVPIRLWHAARRAGRSVFITGCDRSPLAVAAARARASAEAAGVTFFVLDALRDPLPEDFDVIMCSLFLHHLDEREARGLLRSAAVGAGRRVVINDLARSGTALAMVWLAARLLTTSRVVRVDGPRSVRAAFTADELRGLATDAGLAGARVSTRFPARLVLIWDRS